MFINLKDLIHETLTPDLVATLTVPALRWCPCGDLIDGDGDYCSTCYHTDLDPIEDPDPDPVIFGELLDEWLRDLAPAPAYTQGYVP